MRRVVKSTTVFGDSTPNWDETLPVRLPDKFQGTPHNELFLHLLLWNYDAVKQDHVIGQAVFPFHLLRQMAPGWHALLPIAGQAGLYNLAEAKIWLAFPHGDANAA